MLLLRREVIDMNTPTTALCLCYESLLEAIVNVRSRAISGQIFDLTNKSGPQDSKFFLFSADDFSLYLLFALCLLNCENLLANSIHEKLDLVPETSKGSFLDFRNRIT